MFYILISLILFGILILVAISVGFNKKETSEEPNPVLHQSGIYSIVRKTPRDQLRDVKPSTEEIRKYLEKINVNSRDPDNLNLTTSEIDAYVRDWDDSLDRNIEVIEQGDSEGISFYYYDFKPNSCKVCTDYLKKGQFVTREEIYQYPHIIPPFHIGCTCTLFAHHGEKLQDTTEIGMVPLFKNEIAPRLPEWRMIQQSNAVRGTI
jgi:hypothetical protein